MSNKVETIVIFDTAVATDNIGDEIIMESIHKEMNDIFSQYMMLKYSTHTPIMHFFQSLKKSDPQFEYFNKTKYKFIGGSNIFKKRLLCRRADWNINLFDIPFYKNVITIGCGTSFSDGFQIDKYTKWLYSKILSKKYIHSVRDEKTKKFIESIGGKAINTGCATMWSLTREHCKHIPIFKQESVVFTLTGYNYDKMNDQYMIDCLLKEYKDVYFWPQSIGDYEYFSMLKTDNIKIVNPNLESFRNLLIEEQPDYIGTRLHGGIFAMQNFCRTIIISIDNRAKDMDITYNLKCIDRNKIKKELCERINSEIITDIHLDEERIMSWKKQFLSWSEYNEERL